MGGFVHGWIDLGNEAAGDGVAHDGSHEHDGSGLDVGVPSQRGSGCCGESGSQSPEIACQPSSRMNVSMPSCFATGAVFSTVA